MSDLKATVQKVLDYNNSFTEQWGAHCGLTLLEAIPGDEPRFVFRYDATEEHRNIFYGVHGGMTAYLFDTVMGITGDAVADKETSTTELSISYIRAMMGSSYLITIEINKVGRKLLSCTGYISDDEGKKYATCQARYILLERGFK